MSVINKLSMQGIRSFGHEDADRQEIEFFHPLTIIHGQNGAGKTSIIECLRYVTSGVHPPGLKSCFVYDPKMAHETEVKGDVKLEFEDKLGGTVSVTRNVMATQKGKKTEFKAVEGNIYRKDKHGVCTSRSLKSADIDREMVDWLGVSKPVLVNVIFCHQEESNWPLSEGKQLKTKFDEIFDATRYIKAQDSIKKLTQEQEKNMIGLEGKLEHLKYLKEQAAKLEENLKENKLNYRFLKT